MNRICCLAFVLSGIASQQIFAQQLSISGTVQDSTGVIPGAQVTLRDAMGGTARATTDALGQYHFDSLRPGVYEIGVSRQGFASATRALTLNGATQNIDVTLQVAGDSISIDVNDVAGRGTASGMDTGCLGKSRILSIDKNHPSTGSITGAFPPGQPVRVRVYPAELTNDGLNVYSAIDKYPAGYSEPPGPGNGWNKTLYVPDPRLAGAVSVLEYPGSKNGWSRLVLRGEINKVSIILIKWYPL